MTRSDYGEMLWGSEGRKKADISFFQPHESFEPIHTSRQDSDNIPMPAAQCQCNPSHRSLRGIEDMLVAQWDGTGRNGSLSDSWL